MGCGYSKRKGPSTARWPSLSPHRDQSDLTADRFASNSLSRPSVYRARQAESDRTQEAHHTSPHARRRSIDVSSEAASQYLAHGHEKDLSDPAHLMNKLSLSSQDGPPPRPRAGPQREGDDGVSSSLIRELSTRSSEGTELSPSPQRAMPMTQRGVPHSTPERSGNSSSANGSPKSHYLTPSSHPNKSRSDTDSSRSSSPRDGPRSRTGTAPQGGSGARRGEKRKLQS